ncbi:MAG: hypothetical protein AAF766_04925 [Cyanobacteria bacterium P01_D01_bin.14]
MRATFLALALILTNMGAVPVTLVPVLAQSQTLVEQLQWGLTS